MITTAIKSGVRDQKEPLGTFTSTPIHAQSLSEAKEILSRTYKPERFRLVPHQKLDFERIHFGSRYAWTFRVLPVSRVQPTGGK